jgi:signal transduction histidine kinase
MGFGLAISQMIVELHNGKITAMSDANGGAKFEITLPTDADPQVILET